MMTIETTAPGKADRAGSPAPAPSPAPYRCAVYFAPAVDSPWWAAGSQWLGRCAQAGVALPQPAIDGVDPALLRDLTAEPRRYGWHATLKAPFQLAPGCGLEDLRDALHALCGDFPRFTLPPLEARRMDRFIALRTAGPNEALQSLAAACVTRLQPLARPLSPPELARRRQAPLTPDQDALLVRWGYPWVLDHFRFHLSLTGDIASQSPATQAALLQAAQARFGALPACEFGQLSLFVEPEKGADFVLLEQMELRP